MEFIPIIEKLAFCSPLPAEDPVLVTIALEVPAMYHFTTMPGRSVIHVTLDLLPTTCSSFTNCNPNKAHQ